jgi:hypothetical protein
MSSWMQDEPHNPNAAEEAVCWKKLAARIRAIDPDAAQEWVELQWRATWLLLRHRLGASATPDLARTALAEAVDEVRAGRIEEPVQLVGWLQRFAGRVQPDLPLRRVAVEATAGGFSVARMSDLLKATPPRKREALRRFYIGGEDAVRIRLDLDLSSAEFIELRTQFRGALARKGCDAEGSTRTQASGAA